jgi:hypothetical protein
VEWAAPIKVIGKSQGRGNSGVFLMNRYEIQVLDSYDNVTYADGQAAALYGQYPPLVNAARPPGQWQTYDIIFTRPRFGADGKMVSPARFTILHNGVLVQHNVEAVGPTTWMRRPPYEAHADKLPLSLQDHGNPVRYRNIWIRELGSDALGRPEHSYSAKLLNNLAGSYRGATIALENGQLIYKTGSGPNETIFPLFAESPTRFFMKSVDAQIRFELDGTGKAMKLFFSVGGGDEEGRERRN